MNICLVLYPTLHYHASLGRYADDAPLPAAVDAVIAVSECTKRDAVRACGIPKEKITVIYEGVSSRFRPADLDAVRAIRAKYGLRRLLPAPAGTEPGGTGPLHRLRPRQGPPGPLQRD